MIIDLGFWWGLSGWLCAAVAFPPWKGSVVRNECKRLVVVEKNKKMLVSLGSGTRAAQRVANADRSLPLVRFFLR
jgi:hypothetical protein